MSLSGTKRLTVFENGADNLITDVTACKLPRQWKSGKKKGWEAENGREEEFSEEQSESR